MVGSNETVSGVTHHIGIEHFGFWDGHLRIDSNDLDQTTLGCSLKEEQWQMNPSRNGLYPREVGSCRVLTLFGTMTSPGLEAALHEHVL